MLDSLSIIDGALPWGHVLAQALALAFEKGAIRQRQRGAILVGVTYPWAEAPDLLSGHTQSALNAHQGW